jgi:hypothetical protein
VFYHVHGVAHIDQALEVTDDALDRATRKRSTYAKHEVVFVCKIPNPGKSVWVFALGVCLQLLPRRRLPHDGCEPVARDFGTDKQTDHKVMLCVVCLSTIAAPKQF